MDEQSYKAARAMQRILFGCAALLALIMAIVAVYLFVRSRTEGVLEDRGVHSSAVVQSTSAHGAIVTFETRKGVETVEIERLGPTLCPDTGPIQRFGGCEDVPNGLAFDIVYDPRDPNVAQPADVVGAAYARNSAYICGAIAALMIALAVGRWRWLAALKSLRDPNAPRHLMRVLWFRRLGARNLYGIRLFPVQVELEPIDEPGPSVRALVTAPSGLQWIAEGALATAVGDPRPREAVALVDGDALAFPTRKSTRARSSIGQH